MRRRAKGKAEAGSATVSRPATKRCISLATHTRSNAGETTSKARRNWSAGSMVSHSTASFAAKACSRGKPMLRKWRWRGWWRPYAEAARCCSIASSSRLTLPRWVRWRSARNATCPCSSVLSPARSRALPRQRPPPATHWPRVMRLPPEPARCDPCPKPLPRSWRRRHPRGSLPRQGSSLRSF